MNLETAKQTLKDALNKCFGHYDFVKKANFAQKVEQVNTLSQVKNIANEMQEQIAKKFVGGYHHTMIVELSNLDLPQWIEHGFDSEETYQKALEEGHNLKSIANTIDINNNKENGFYFSYDKENIFQKKDNQIYVYSKSGHHLITLCVEDVILAEEITPEEKDMLYMQYDCDLF